MNLLRRFYLMRAAARGTKFPWEISVRGGAVFLVQVDLLRFAAFSFGKLGQEGLAVR